MTQQLVGLSQVDLFTLPLVYRPGKLFLYELVGKLWLLRSAI